MGKDLTATDKELSAKYAEIAKIHNITDQSKLAEYWSYIELIHNWQEAYKPKAAGGGK